MALKVDPSNTLQDIAVGEEVSFELDITEELGSNTVASHAFAIYDSSDADVTSTLGGDSSISSGMITFGIKAALSGIYKLQFIITCNELLPDSITPEEFYVIMIVRIR